MKRQRFFCRTDGLGVNNALAYPNYFAMIPTGPDPNAALTEGFFALAAEQKATACDGGTRIRGCRVLCATPFLVRGLMPRSTASELFTRPPIH